MNAIKIIPTNISKRFVEIKEELNKVTDYNLVYNLVPSFIVRESDGEVIVKLLRDKGVIFDVINPVETFETLCSIATKNSDDEDELEDDEDDIHDDIYDEMENSAYERKMERLLQQEEDRYN
jgi:hypothetical protein